MRFIFFTKTLWPEPPRLRHQLAQLLAKAGHEIVFFERPAFLWQTAASEKSGYVQIHLYRYVQGLHHKLRLHPILHHTNAVIEKVQIARLAKEIKVSKKDVIINFNYDYFFLRDLFPQYRIITIINDDFWSRAIAGYESPLKWVLEKTCRLSDIVLTVSPPLVEQLEEYCKPKLFYPWADVPYKKPANSDIRNKLLFWGYIGERIDFDYVMNLAKLASGCGDKLEIQFVGPIQKGRVPFEALDKINNIEILSERGIDDIPLENVIAAFIPYKSHIKENDAVTLPNKALQLMARGFPLVITGMPNFIEKPFVLRLGVDLKADLENINRLRQRFWELQPYIRSFVDKNSSSQRMDQFFGYL
jgi:hypothetical protein